MSVPSRRKDEMIQNRTSAEVKAILNRAVALRSLTPSEIMLESARQQAEKTIRDQRTFFLDHKAHAGFFALLDSPPRPSAMFRARFNRKSPWGL
jgi:uncharacterized protein (DUF1778 family)